MWAKSQDSVHKPQFLKRKESQSRLNRGPSAYQPSTVPLGHTGSQGDTDLEEGLYACQSSVMGACGEPESGGPEKSSHSRLENLEWKIFTHVKHWLVVVRMVARRRHLLLSWKAGKNLQDQVQYFRCTYVVFTMVSFCVSLLTSFWISCVNLLKLVLQFQEIKERCTTSSLVYAGQAVCSESFTDDEYG